MTKNVCVIGGTGFIGDYLALNLNSKNDIKTTILYKSTPPLKKSELTDYIKLDASKNTQKLRNILGKTDYLVILSRPDIKIIQNIIKSKANFGKIVFASTILIYPSSKKIQDESSKLIAANEYEKGKIDEEEMLKNFAKDTKTKVCIARFTNIYGDVKNRGLVHFILNSLVTNKSFKLNNAGKQVRDFLFIEDAARYLELLIFAPQTKSVEIFNICSGKGYSANELISRVENISGKKLSIIPGDLTDEKICVIGDNSKVVKKTGFKPEFSLDKGLKKAISNYQNYVH